MALETLRQCDLHDNCVIIYPINIGGCPMCKLEGYKKQIDVIQSILDRKEDE
jgi:hypothetical protein